MQIDITPKDNRARHKLSRRHYYAPSSISSTAVNSILDTARAIPFQIIVCSVIHDIIILCLQTNSKEKRKQYCNTSANKRALLADKHLHRYSFRNNFFLICCKVTIFPLNEVKILTLFANFAKQF